jgi:type II secretory pathway pseudopilin PulG
MIGVLAVVAILATIMVSTTTRQIDYAAGNLESTNLVKYATSLQNSILRNRHIPGANDIVTMIAAELAIDPKDVSTNARQNTRLFLFDPYFGKIGTAANFWTLASGWSQNDTGSTWADPLSAAGDLMPLSAYNARVIIVSSMGGNLPAAGSINPTIWQNLWITPDGTVPPDAIWNGWRGDDLKVQRIDFESLFLHLILYDYHSSDLPQYAIDGLPNITLSATKPFDAYMLRGTEFGLFDGSGNLQATQVLNRDTSFAYVQQIWRSSINLGEGVDAPNALLGNAMFATAVAFEASPYNLNSSVTPPQVVNDMQAFMKAYLDWVNAGFAPGSAQDIARAAQNTMVADMNNLINNLSSGDCTNAPAIIPTP